MKRAALLCALVACAPAATPPGSRSHATTGPAPAIPATIAPLATATATASVASAAPRPPRTTPTTPAARDLELILRDVCPIEYVVQQGAISVGCARCDDFAAPFAASLFTVTDGDLATWVGTTPVRGAFTAAGADEAFVIFAGGCNAKHTGLALFARRDGRWTALASSPAKDYRGCAAVARRDGRSLLVCDKSVANPTTVPLDELWVEDFGGESSGVLLSFPHWDAVQVQVPPIVRDFALASFVAVDDSGDGLTDIVAEVVERARPRDAVQQQDHDWSRAPALRTHRLLFVNDGSRLRADRRTAALLAGWARALPRGP